MLAIYGPKGTLKPRSHPPEANEAVKKKTPRSERRRISAEDAASAVAIIEGGPILVRAVIIGGERIEVLRWRETRADKVLFAGDDGVAGAEGGDDVGSAPKGTAS